MTDFTLDIDFTTHVRKDTPSPINGNTTIARRSDGPIRIEIDLGEAGRYLNIEQRTRIAQTVTQCFVEAAQYE